MRGVRYMSIFESLGIDIRQIITTIIGFGIFYWILKKFAFGPFMKLLDDRRETITSTFARLESERKEIANERDKYEALIENIEDERHKQLQEGLQEAKKLSAGIQEEAHKKAEAIIHRAEESTARELAQAKLELRNYMVELSIRSAELALKESITDDDHRRIFRRYVEDLDIVETSGGEL